VERTSESFRSSASVAAVLAGAAGLVYSLAFVVVRSELLAALMLTLGGLLSVVALVALFGLVREAGTGLATVGLIFGVVGVLGAAVHGAYDLANVLQPVAATAGPNAADPRGFLTFGVAGLGVLALSALALRTARVPRAWGWLGLFLGVLLLIIYLGRLVLVDARNPLLLVPAALTGLVINPLWYIWLGLILRRTDSNAG
jgi:hypothetical protein